MQEKTENIIFAIDIFNETNDFMGQLPVKLKIRNRQSHKGTYGSAYLFAGSEGMMGAALLSARSCMRSGLGLLTVHTASCGYYIIQLGIPEAKCESDYCAKYITSIFVPQGIKAVGIGPGIGQNIDTANAIHEFLIKEKTEQHRLVLDADALNILSKNPDWFALLPEGTILTPHPGEWKRLKEGINIYKEKQQAEGKECKLPRVIIVFKDAYTRVADTDLSTGEEFASWTNTEHGHSGMAVGGSGDTLTGIILSLLAQDYAPIDAACLGVYVHSLAADLALEGQSEESWLPSDLIDCLGKSFSLLSQSQK